MEDKLMTMSEYATSRGISYEAVRKKVIRNRDKLNLCKKGRTTYLTKQAIEFLDEHKHNFSHPAYKPDVFSDLEELIAIQAKEIDWYKSMLETQHVIMDILKISRRILATSVVQLGGFLINKNIVYDF